ncbi:MAG: 16S rRNA (uracil(1498)-N(3))-methyltransferase [Bacillota bacterium]|nr:16S rRNA (uracil(1498)-N(3))-methyltransferase [Bacillota bacterium]
MSKFFITGCFENGDEIKLDGPNSHHVRHVLRMKTGQELTVCDGRGFDYLCSLSRFDDDSVFVSVNSKLKTPAEPTVLVSLFVAMPKSDKLETVIQKAVELGVYEITPFFSSRCVSRPDDRAQARKTERFRKISEEAAKQSGRGIIPNIHEPVGFDDMLKKATEHDLSLMAYEGERNVSLLNALQNKGNFLRVSAVIGSEGGFTSGEAEAANASGLITVSLGPRIMRCETAPIAMLSAIMFFTGNF